MARPSIGPHVFLLAVNTSAAAAAAPDVAAALGERLAAYARAWAGDGTINVWDLAEFYAEDPGIPSFGPSSDQAWTDSAVDSWGRVELDPDAKRIALRRVGPLGFRRLGDFVLTTSEFQYDVDYGAAGKTSIRLRQTAIWEQADGSWRMLHEHLSAPADASPLVPGE